MWDQLKCWIPGATCRQARYAVAIFPPLLYGTYRMLRRARRPCFRRCCSPAGASACGATVPRCVALPCAPAGDGRALLAMQRADAHPARRRTSERACSPLACRAPVRLGTAWGRGLIDRRLLAANGPGPAIFAQGLTRPCLCLLRKCRSSSAKPPGACCMRRAASPLIILCKHMGMRFAVPACGPSAPSPLSHT